jgi:hypothetical protein
MTPTRRWLCDGCHQWFPMPAPGPLATEGMRLPWWCFYCSPAAETNAVARRILALAGLA